MLKILHARLQHYVNQECPDVQAGFRKDRGARDQIANICWIREKAREHQKNIYLCFINFTKAFDCVDHNKLWKALKEMGIPDPSNLSPEKPIFGSRSNRALYGTTDCFRIEKGVHQGCLLSPCLFNLCVEHTMRNTRLNELQAEIKIGGRKSTISVMQMIPL